MTKLQQWITFAVVGIVVILAAGWFLLVSPQRAKAAATHTQVTSELSSTASLRTQLDVLRAQARQLPAKQAELAKFSRQIPSTAALPALVRSLTDAASTAHVDLQSIAPGPPAAPTATVPVAPVVAPSPGATPSAAPATTLAAPVAASPLQVVPLAIKVNGTYVQLEQFVANLEALQRVLLVSAYTIGPGSPLKPATTSTTATGTATGCSRTACTLDMSLTGQVFLAPAPAAPPVPVTLK